MRGVSYAILTLGNSCSVLPSLETFHSTTTEKSICLFTDVAINEVAWYMIKQKRWCNETAILHPTQTNFHGVTNNKNIRPILGTLCTIIRQPPFLRWWIRKKFSSYIQVNTVFQMWLPTAVLRNCSLPLVCNAIICCNQCYFSKKKIGSGTHRVTGRLYKI
jgi:hypothetical protein